MMLTQNVFGLQAIPDTRQQQQQQHRETVDDQPEGCGMLLNSGNVPSYVMGSFVEHL